MMISLKKHGKNLINMFMYKINLVQILYINNFVV